MFKIISKKRYNELVRTDKKAEEQRIIIQNYYKEFEEFCLEYDLQLDYQADKPSKNFMMIRKLYFKLFKKESRK